MRWLYAAQFVVIGTYMPFMPVWLAAQGLSATQIGLVLTVPMAARTLLAPWIAYGIDRYGDRHRAVAALAAGAAVATAALYGVADFAGILAVFVAISLFWCALMPVTDASAIASVRTSGLDYGRMRLWGSASFIAANLAAGLLVDRASPAAAIAIIALSFLAVGYFSVRLPGLAQSAPASAPLPYANAWRLLSRPLFLATIALAGLLNASHALLYGFGTLHWQTLGYSNTVIGWLWAIGVVAEIALFAFSARVVSRVSPFGLLIAAAVAAVVRWMAMAVEPPFEILLALQLLHGLTFGAMHIGMVNLVADAVPDRLGATAQSMMYAASSLIMALVTPFAGRLYGLHAGEAYWAMAAIAAAALALLLPVGLMRRAATG